jgi:mRNA interferase RelE/StbE
MEGLSNYAISGRGDVKRLEGSEFSRLRIGRLRVIFDEDRTTVLTIYVGKRETTTYRRV